MESNMIQNLTERAKELECVYAVDEILQHRRLTLPEMIERMTKVIPTGFSCPQALRVRISLLSEGYESPGFDGSDVICRTPIRVEEEVVGEIVAGYRRELLEGECPLLDYEVKLMETIAGRVSQLTLGRRRELSLLMNMLRQIDPNLLLTIGEKLRVHIKNTLGIEAGDVFQGLVPAHDNAYGETNRTMMPAQYLCNEELIRKLVEAALTFLPQDTVLSLLNEWIHEFRILAFVKTVDRKDSRVSDILDAVLKYTGAVSQEAGNHKKQHTLTETWLKSELAHRFLSEDEHLINLVLDNISIQDFGPMIEKVIGSERSMGNIGGKGAGLFIASQILRHASQSDPLLTDIKTPRTWYIAADQIVDFLHYNNLEELNFYKYNSVFHLRMTYDTIIQKIKNGRLPAHTMNMLMLALEDMRGRPLIVRSSSLLEDRHSGTFSGKYKSLFLCNKGTRQQRLDALVNAVLEVYASMYNPDAIQYRRERGLLHFTEQMGVMIQEVVGRKVGPYFLPMFAGVAFSRNLLRWSSRIQPEDGLVRLVMGLGTRAVDRVNDDYPLMFAPGQPKLQINQIPADVYHYSPKHIDLIHEEKGFVTVDAQTFLREMHREIPDLYQYVSVYENDFIQNKNAFSLNPARDTMVITFQHVLFSTEFAAKIKRMMEVLSKKLQCPVDIEYAYDGESLYLLQCRPQGTGLMRAPAAIPQNIKRQDTLFTANRFISDGLLENVSYVVYVDPEGYSQLSSREELLAVGEAVGLLNDILPRRKFLLIGPGRWGSRGDIQLGVRVTYSDICNTGALIEVAREKHSYVPELSFGTHFFQDLVEAGILYVPLYPDQKDALFNESFFLRKENMLGSILPKYARLSDTLKVIDISASSQGRTLSLHMNSELNQAVAYLSSAPDESAAQSGDPFQSVWKDWHLENDQEHWQWRHYMAQKIAEGMDMERFGVKGVYLFGSTDTGSTGIGSDIDLLVHVEDANDKVMAPFRQWLDGWSRALARINFLQTGFDAETLLDVHIITDEDIRAGNSYAIKINSPTDPATLLRVR